MLVTIVVVFVLYLLLMLLISWRGRKHASSFSEYLTVNGRTPLILLVGGAVGAQVGNGLVVGGAGSGAAVGLAGAGYGVACALGYIVLMFFTHKIRTTNLLTPAEYLQQRYNSKAAGQLLNVSYAISCLPSIGSQLIAAKVLFDALGLNGTVGVIALCVVVFLYSQISGLWGALATSVAQICIIAVGVITGAIIVLAKGGIGEIGAAMASGAVPESFLSLKGYDTTTWMFVMIPLMLAAPIDNISWQRVIAAKDEKTARNHFWVSTLVMLPLVAAPVLIGMYGRVHFGLTDNTAFFSVIMNIFPPIIAAFVVVAVIAAVMSTIDGMMIGQSVVLIRGIYKNTIGKNATDEQLKKLTLPVNIVTLILAALFAFSTNSIIGLLSNVYLFIGAVALAPVICGWFWKGTTVPGAVAAMICGLIIAVLQLFGIYELPYSGITYVLPPFVVLFVVSLLTKKTRKE